LSTAKGMIVIMSGTISDFLHNAKDFVVTELQELDSAIQQKEVQIGVAVGAGVVAFQQEVKNDVPPAFALTGAIGTGLVVYTDEVLPSPPSSAVGAVATLIDNISTNNVTDAQAAANAL
jgi:hypothetical protein